MRFVRTLKLDSTQKAINVLYCIDDSLYIPEFDSTDMLLSWCEQVLSVNRSALCLYTIEKSSFLPQSASALVPSFRNPESLGQTDIYYRNLYQSDLASQIQVTKIEPCTLVHIKKYTEAGHKRVIESPVDYHKKVLPYIQSIPAERTAWVTKVLNGQSQERILYQDKDNDMGFILVPDLYWSIYVGSGTKNLSKSSTSWPSLRILGLRV
jgi:hypothetical protein